MLRSLLLLLHILSVLVCLDISMLGVGAAPHQTEAASADDCCGPKKASTPGGDCCDYDFGRCCAPGHGAVTPRAPVVAAQRRLERTLLQVPPSSLPVQRQDVMLRLHPHTTGPPPTPPPIAGALC